MLQVILHEYCEVCVSKFFVFTSPGSFLQPVDKLYGRTYITIIKTHDSESRGQEEAAVRDERVSYLQVAPLKNSQTL